MIVFTATRSLVGILIALALAWASTVAAQEKPASDKVRIALAQLHSESAGDLTAIESYVAEAAANHSEMVVFPESSQFGWLSPDVFSDAETVPGAFTNALSAIAIKHGVWIAIGMAERGPSLSGGLNHAHDTAVLIAPDGEIVLHSRKSNVLGNAFDEDACPPDINAPDGTCAYAPAPATQLQVKPSPLGKTALLVCADAYAFHDTTALDHVKSQGAEAVIIVWGVAAAALGNCGTAWHNATMYAEDAAQVTGALTIGANAVGPRPFGRYRPSVYCGFSGIISGDGKILGQGGMAEGVIMVDVPRGGA